jgi:hypothetical protein
MPAHHRLAEREHYIPGSTRDQTEACPPHPPTRPSFVLCVAYPRSAHPISDSFKFHINGPKVVK